MRLGGRTGVDDGTKTHDVCSCRVERNKLLCIIHCEMRVCAWIRRKSGIIKAGRRREG